MINYKDFLLNVFFIFSPLVFYPYINKIKTRVFVPDFLWYLLLSFSVICTMSFPVQLNAIIYDFRSIPLAISFLYCRARVSLSLCLTLVLYRFIMGNPNSFLYLCSLLLSFLLFYLLFKKQKYESAKLKTKVIYAMLICTLIKLVTISSYLILINETHLLLNKPLTTIETYLLQAVVVGIYVCLLEYVNKYFMMQEEMITSEKMKIVSDFAASVAHEVRNPLTAVKGFIQLLGNEKLTHDRRQYYQKICLEELDRAQNIISDYLSLAKPDPETFETIDIKEEAEYVSSILLTYANYNNVTITTHLIDHAFVQGERHKLRQAFINLGKNAIEAMPNGGELEFILKKTNDSAILTIRDTGVGMTKEQINRLGTPYYSTKEKGTGLGTMVSFRIIENMQGKIEISSKPGTGTECHIIFSS